MKSKFFRIPSLLLALCLILSGCSSSTKDPGTSQSAASELSKKETITYTAMLPNNSSMYPGSLSGNPNDCMPIVKMLEDNGNVRFNWTVVSPNDLNTTKSLLLAGGDIPDISFNIFNDSDVVTYGPGGTFLPLENLIQQYMPNFISNATTENAGVLKELTLSDSHIYTLPTLGAPNNYTTTGVYINQKWLDKLGLSTPSTTDELFNVLSAFQKGDPNGNGKNDEIGFAYDQSASWCNGAINAWFGVTDEIMIRDGVVTYSPYMDGWKEMVKFLNRLWKAGLLDQELFTQNTSTFTAKAAENMYGCIMSYSLATSGVKSDSYNDFSILMPQNGGTKVWGALRQRPEGNYIVLNKAVVSAKVKNPERLLSAMDYFYDPEIAIQVTNGPIGWRIDYDSKGNLVRTDTAEGWVAPDKFKGCYHWNQFPCGNIYTLQRRTLVDTEITRSQIIQFCAKYNNSFINEVMPYNFMTTEENATFTQYKTDLTKYVNECYAKWVTGESSVDSDWNSYLAHLEKLGVKEYVEAYQKYYNRICK